MYGFNLFSLKQKYWNIPISTSSWLNYISYPFENKNFSTPQYFAKATSNRNICCNQRVFFFQPPPPRNTNQRHVRINRFILSSAESKQSTCLITFHGMFFCRLISVDQKYEISLFPYGKRLFFRQDLRCVRFLFFQGGR